MTDYRVVKDDEFLLRRPATFYLTKPPPRHGASFHWSLHAEDAVLLDQAEAQQIADRYNARDEKARHGSLARVEAPANDP
jgi:hypothetical protein